MRLKKLQNTLENFQHINNKKYLQQYCEVLIENKLDNQEKYFGRTKYMTPVIFKANNCKAGDLVNVKITSCNQKNLFGACETNKVKSSITFVKINKQNKNDKEVTITHEEDDSINVRIFNNKILMGIVGSFDNNLKELEKISGSKIYFRGNSIAIKGDKYANEKVKDAIEYLIQCFRSDKKIDGNDITASLSKDMIQGTKTQLTVQSLGEVIKTPKRSVISRSKKQKEYVRSLKSDQIVMSLGPAGTGKTYLAVAVALSMLLEKKVERIILSRPAVEAGERLGFLPGDMKEKIDPYLRPLYDSLYDLLDYDKIQRKIESGAIEIAPLAFMRGRTLKNSFAILDEAQNATETQIKMFLTRIGENSRLVVNGDPSQVDLPNKNQSGLIKSQDILKGIKEISIINFDHQECDETSIGNKNCRSLSKEIPMIKVNVEVSNKSWNKKIKNPKRYFSKKLKKISKIVKFFKGKNVTFTILLTNSLNMKKLNKKFRNRNKSTDVLSFPFFSIKRS